MGYRFNLKYCHIESAEKRLKKIRLFRKFEEIAKEFEELGMEIYIRVRYLKK